ncbi:phospholipase D family protein [Tenacibaculum finnmarkense]|uniref:phospholipase D family protein n=1 Tax=Tenacibaculum finnmarkense TaxID=2781243 RepID=UPI00187BA592|nr:phospholipase D family protein [Tenacibaculum finnmarkense]MBE7647632.1 NgoFVII family restriction endonuclease [Tenacibaculum finnmarkense genomovar ulcerans]WCC47917.1 phospholipase D family protein [Tenacibaculum finnmarkense]
MFINNAKCDIYIGKAAGKHLISDIQNAKKSIKIVSPYLSASLVKELIKLKAKKLNIELITSDNIEDFKNDSDKNIRKLIVQNKKKKGLSAKRWQAISQIIIFSIIGVLMTMLFAFYETENPLISIGFIPVIILCFVYRSFSKKIAPKNTYRYSQLFPFKVYMSPYKSKLSDSFIHSKIYIIDDKIAYVGSLNFTVSGLKNNYETSVRTKDSSAIKEIKKEFNQLFHHANLHEKDIQLWGAELYENKTTKNNPKKTA